MKPLSDEALRVCVTEGRDVALVRVRSAEVSNVGSMSERTNATILVEKVVLGTLSGERRVWTWSGEGRPVVQVGRLYVMAVATKTPDKMGPWVEVPAGAEDEAVRVHRKAIERLQAADGPPSKPGDDHGR